MTNEGPTVEDRIIDALQGFADYLRSQAGTAPTPQPEPETYTSEQAWEKMEQGWCVTTKGALEKSFFFYLNGAGLAVHDKTGVNVVGPLGRSAWLRRWGDSPMVVVRIHPDAHKHAMQRHLAAGLVVGSRVEVVHHEQGEGVRYWQGKTPVSSQHTVVEIRSGSSSLRLDNGRIVPAHCLRLLPAEPETTGAGLRVGDKPIASQFRFGLKDEVAIVGLVVGRQSMVGVRRDETYTVFAGGRDIPGIPASALRPIPASENDGGGE